MKKLISILLLIILLTSCVSITTFAQEGDDTVTFYFDCPKGFTEDNTVICLLWYGMDYIRVAGELTDNGLFKFTISDFTKYEGMVFDNDRTVVTDSGYYHEDNYKSTITFFMDEGKIYLDRYQTIEGSPNNLVLTNQVYLDSLNMSQPSCFYGAGEWLTLSQWHRSDAFYKYLDEKGAKFPNIMDVLMDLWYMYDELYLCNTEDGELAYSLVFGATPDKINQQAYEVYGNYILRQKETYSPDPFSYYIYLGESDSYVTLKEAFDMGVPNIEDVFTVYGLGELIGDVDNDKKLSILDATKIQRCLAGIERFNENDEVVGEHSNESVDYISDFNRDGKRNIFDVTLIQQNIAKIVDTF